MFVCFSIRLKYRVYAQGEYYERVTIQLKNCSPAFGDGTLRHGHAKYRWVYRLGDHHSTFYSNGLRSKSLKADDKMFNKIISKIRVRIEHVFGFVENSMHGSSLRSIGFDRAVLNTDLTNLTYNLLRYEQVKRLNLKTWR